jgi:hypothetical protein
MSPLWTLLGTLLCFIPWVFLHETIHFLYMKKEGFVKYDFGVVKLKISFGVGFKIYLPGNFISVPRLIPCLLAPFIPCILLLGFLFSGVFNDIISGFLLSLIVNVIGSSHDFLEALRIKKYWKKPLW